MSTLNAINATVETLHPYAVQPRPEAPPELLPWDSARSVGLDGAARQALGLLVAGEKPGTACTPWPTICWPSTQPPTARWLSPTSCCSTARRWRCAATCARATTPRRTSGASPARPAWPPRCTARKAALENHIGADCLLAVCQVADETGLPILADLITLRERMWGRLLDHSRAETLHVSEADYPAHMKPLPAR